MKGTPNVPQCGFSRAVVQLLDINGVEPATLKTYNVLEDQELRDAIKEYSSWPTIPQLYVNGEFVGGCDILLGMHQSGELSQVGLSFFSPSFPYCCSFGISVVLMMFDSQLLTKEGVVAKGEEASS